MVVRKTGVINLKSKISSLKSETWDFSWC